MRFRPGTPVADGRRAGRGPARRRPRRRRAGPLLRQHRPRRGADPARDARGRPRRRPVHRAGRRAHPRRRSRGRARGVRRHVGTRACGIAATAHGLVLVVPLLRGGHRRRRRGEPRGLRRPRPAGRRRADRRRLEPRPRRGPAAPERFGSLPALVDRIRAAVAAPGSGWRRSSSGPRPRWPASTPTGWSGPPGATGARTSSGLDLTHPGVRDLLAAHARSGWSDLGDRLPQARLPLRRRGARTPAPTLTRSRPTGPGWRWSARWSARTSTWSAAARRCCPASAWSTPCGSPPTPSTRAARTGPPVCAASCRWRRAPGSRAGSGSTTPTAWWPGRRTPQRERWADAARPLGRAAVLLRPGRRAGRVGLATVRELLADGGTRDAAAAAERVRDGGAARAGRGPRHDRDRPGPLAARISPLRRAALPRPARRGAAPTWSRWPTGTPPGCATARIAPPTHRTACLITYGDGIRRPGETPLHTLAGFLHEHVGDVVSDVHLLPMFPWTSDDGFAVVDHRRGQPRRSARWDDVARARRATTR